MLYFSRFQKVVLGILLAALAAGVGTLLYGRGRLAALGPAEPFFMESPPGARRPAFALVDITGAVAKPGLYRLPAGARVHELVEKAGGTTPKADLAAVNLAAVVHDGEKIHVPEKQVMQQGEMKKGAGGKLLPNGKSSRSQGQAKTLPRKPISLNSASAEELQQLPGIGPVLAERIIQHRQHLKAENGVGFEGKEQLLEVPGIGAKKYADLREYISL